MKFHGRYFKSIIVLLAIITSTCVARADGSLGENTMRAASYVLASALRANGQLIIDSEERAHMESPAASFMKINQCVYAAREPSLDGERFIIVNFKKFTGSYGKSSDGFVYAGDFNANCWGVGNSKLCSGALHIPFSANELMVYSGVMFVKRHGC